MTQATQQQVHLATIRLFKAIQIERHLTTAPDQETLKQTIPFGYVLDPSIVASPELLESINAQLGISGEQANATFHKSWEKIRTADMEQLVIEQMLHYLTTYGYSALGVYDPSNVYIPNEKLEVPDFDEDLSVTFVRGLTAEELLQEIIRLGSGVALHEQSLNDIITIVKANKFEPDYLPSLNNHELLARLYDFYGLVPEEPVDFLRYAIYKLTESSLIIKNDELIGAIKEVKSQGRRVLDTLLNDAPGNLASIFYRFKPIFLALKSISKNKNYFNRLRKQAVRLHEPLPTDYLNSVTEQIKNQKLDLDELVMRVDRAPVFRKIRLAYALQFRLSAGQSIVYPVRNGLGWATDFQWPDELMEDTARALEIVMASVEQDLRPNVNGKKFFVPSNVNYALPSSEKQFAGPFPVGSYVTSRGDTVFGVHWFNTKGRSIDLDLSLLSAEGKVGWDAAYRNSQALFSGDITDAPRPNGATEMFYVKEGIAPNLVMCNYYNFSAANPVDAKIVVASESPKELTANYMVDVNRIVAKADVTISRKQTVLGLVLTVDGQNRFYFGNVSVGCGITATENQHSVHARNYLSDRFTNCMDLKVVLEKAGAKIVEERPDGDDFVALSPENLSKGSIISLFQKCE